MHLKKILVIINALRIGGAEKDIVRNFPVLHQMPDFDITILTYEQPGELAKTCEQAGITMLVAPPLSPRLEFLQRVPLIKNILMVIKIQQVIQQVKPDIVHVFLVRPYLYIGFGYLMSSLLRRPRPPLVMSRLNLNFYQKKYPLLSKIEIKLCHRQCTKIVANSKAIMRDLDDEAVSTDKQYLLYNGIETEQFTVNRTIKFYHKNEFIITALGNLHSYKGYRDLLTAVRLMREQKPDLAFKLLVAGRDEKNNLAQYQRFLKIHQLEEYMEFIGHCDDIAGFLQQGHLHVHPSHTEGLPSAIIEAMSAELPIVATNVGGIPELIDVGKTGILVAAHAPREFTQAMLKMLSDPQKMYDYGQAGKAKADKLFNIQQSVQAYQKLYATIT